MILIDETAYELVATDMMKTVNALSSLLQSS